jgi:phosphoribosyl 1,2-cyclic phosphodiesterase
MNITLHGVRGSIPTTNPATKKYGGNTSCVEVEAEGWRLILDAGSGMHNVDISLPFLHNRVDILLTHLHMDHIQGLGFFRPLFDQAAEIHIWGPASKSQSLRARLGKYFSPPLFPVYFRNLSCKLVLHEVEDNSFEIGPFRIDSRYIIHPGPTVGYRINHQNSSLAYLPDHEPSLGRNGLLPDLRWLSGSDLALDVDLLLHDAQYTAEEYKARVGWGHTSQTDAVRFAHLTRVRHLLLMHHDPARTDAALDLLLANLQESNPAFSFTCEMAWEGLQVQL